SSICCPAALASSTPFGLRTTSVHPVNRISLFQVLSPWRSNTSVFTSTQSIRQDVRLFCQQFRPGGPTACRPAGLKRPDLAGVSHTNFNMDPLRFIHAADLHLDSPFRGSVSASAALKARLQSATLGAFRRVVDHTITSKADFLVIAGDIYDSKD